MLDWVGVPFARRSCKRTGAAARASRGPLDCAAARLRALMITRLQRAAAVVHMAGEGVGGGHQVQRGLPQLTDRVLRIVHVQVGLALELPLPQLLLQERVLEAVRPAAAGRASQHAQHAQSMPGAASMHGRCCLCAAVTAIRTQDVCRQCVTCMCMRSQARADMAAVCGVGVLQSGPHCRGAPRMPQLRCSIVIARESV